MKKIVPLVGLALGSLYGIEKEPDAILNNSFTVAGDFAYFRREQGENHVLLTDLGLNGRCKTRSLISKMGFEPGFKVAATYTTDHSVWDLSYLSINEWSSKCSRENREMIFLFHGDFQLLEGADKGVAKYGSSFHNAELNYYRYVSPRHGEYFSAAYLLGLRYMTLRESLNIALKFREDKTSYKVHTSNRIPAAQVGGLIAWNPTERLTWDLIGMVGMGFDWGDQKSRFGNVIDYKKTGFSTPLVVEGIIRLGYQPASFINLHIAYQFIYLNGVILAPDQLAKNGSTKHVYRDGGDPLFHGLTAGVGWSF